MSDGNIELTLKLTVDDVNKILTGLDYYQKDIEKVAQKVVQISQPQINAYNKALEDEEKKEQSQNKDKGDKK